MCAFILNLLRFKFLILVITDKLGWNNKNLELNLLKKTKTLSLVFYSIKTPSSKIIIIIIIIIKIINKIMTYIIKPRNHQLMLMSVGAEIILNYLCWLLMAGLDQRFCFFFLLKFNFNLFILLSLRYFSNSICKLNLN